MRAKRRQSREELKKRSRVTKEQADRERHGDPVEGVRLPVPSYAEGDQTSFLGVDEPVVGPDDRGEPPPPVPLPAVDHDPGP
jgi:hypothetical protein